jgi:hypothetical protein
MHEMNQRTVLLTLAVVALLTSCQSLTDKPSKEVARETSVGRYQMVTTPTKTLKLDTATGQTWSLDADSLWKPLTNTDSPENKTRIIAEFVAESLIATKSYNQNSGQLETVTEAQKKQMAAAAVKQAFDAYEHPKTAEQYLRMHQ